MANYISHVARNYAYIATLQPLRKKELRHHFDSVLGNHHGRSVDLLCHLGAAFEILLRFLHEEGDLGSYECTTMWEAFWCSQHENLDAQQEYQGNEKEEEKFLDLLGAALFSQRAFVLEFGDEPVQRRGAFIGWEDDKHFYFEPEIAYAVAQNLAREQNRALSYTPNILWKRIAERGYSVATPEKNLVRRTFGGGRKYFLCIPKEPADPTAPGFKTRGRQKEVFIRKSPPFFLTTTIEASTEKFTDPGTPNAPKKQTTNFISKIRSLKTELATKSSL